MNILGKGINAIEIDCLNFKNEEQNAITGKNIYLTQIILGKYQPRKRVKITKESLQDLVESIKEHGILQPIIVRQIEFDKYELITGERRYRSALEIGLTDIPCIIKTVTEKEAFAIALIENIQREQLTLLEESEALLKLKEEHFLSVDQVSKIIGKPRSTIANLIRVASLLSPEGKQYWENGDVDYGHIRAIIVLEHKFQNVILQYVIYKKFSVRQTENFIKEKKYFALLDKPFEKNETLVISNDEIRAISNQFLNIYNKDVKIKVLSSGCIKVSIHFDNIEQTYEYLNPKN